MKKYLKIVYQTEPIGEHKIILYLTTFDREKFEEDNIITHKTEKIVLTEPPKFFNIANQDQVKILEDCLNNKIGQYYNNKIKEYEKLLEQQQQKIKHLESIKFMGTSQGKIKNITNSDDVHCDIVYGNITNCDNIYCTEVRGNIVNCDKIIYK